MNTYYRVTEPHSRIGYSGTSTPTGEYYNSSRISKMDEMDVSLSPGDEIHVLYGGTFHVDANGDVTALVAYRKFDTSNVERISAVLQ